MTEQSNFDHTASYNKPGEKFDEDLFKQKLEAMVEEYADTKHPAILKSDVKAEDKVISESEVVDLTKNNPKTIKDEAAFMKYNEACRNRKINVYGREKADVRQSTQEMAKHNQEVYKRLVSLCADALNSADNNEEVMDLINEILINYRYGALGEDRLFDDKWADHLEAKFYKDLSTLAGRKRAGSEFDLKLFEKKLKTITKNKEFQYSDELQRQVLNICADALNTTDDKDQVADIIYSQVIPRLEYNIRLLGMGSYSVDFYRNLALQATKK